MARPITIYTDGSSLGNPGPGGYGIVIIRPSETGEPAIEELSAGFQKTTNNRMELLGAIVVLEKLERTDTPLVLKSDSSYVVNAVNQNWIANWKRAEWMRAGKLIPNTDLWQRLDRLLGRVEVRFEKVRAHSGVHYNERADILAKDAAQSTDLAVDGGYMGSMPMEMNTAVPKVEKKFSHLDAGGKVQMVNVNPKEVVSRSATAEATVNLNESTVEAIYDGKIPKGDVLTTAKIAAISAAKRTAELIPLCHTIPIGYVRVEFERRQGEGKIQIRATVEADWKTGVEMEALTAVTVAALSLYDMCKAVDKSIVISDIRLVRKTKQ